MFLLDTDTSSYVMKRLDKALVEKIKGFAPGELKVSAITAFELEYGARRSQRYEHFTRVIHAFLENVEVLPFTSEAGCEAGAIRATLAALGNLIGAYDLLIAGHARALKATLVTNNVGEFSRVDDLAIENWAAQPMTPAVLHPLLIRPGR